MKYVRSKLEIHRKDYLFKNYIADAIYYKGQNKIINVRLIDLMKPKPIDNRSGDEIAEDVISKLGLILEE